MSDLPKANQRITADERARILHLRKRRVSVPVIARELQRSRYSVIKVIREAQGILYGTVPAKPAACPAFVERLLKVHPGAIDGRYERVVPPSPRKPLTGSEVARSLPWLGLKI